LKFGKAGVIFTCSIIIALFKNPVGAANIDYIDKLVAGQNVVSKDIRNFLIRTNLSQLWLKTESNNIYGFIGNNYQRLQIKILKIKQDDNNKTLYHIFGKDKVNERVTDFKGTFKVISAFKTKDMEKEGKDTGILIGEYILYENKNKPKSGFFKGRFITYWYKDDKGKIFYDDICAIVDDFSNNQFVGIWKSYKDKVGKKCNWGDYRIPDSEEFDNGACEFCPDEKYEIYGWKNYNDAYFRQNENSQKAKQIELEEWWK